MAGSLQFDIQGSYTANSPYFTANQGQTITVTLPTVGVAPVQVQILRDDPINNNFLGTFDVPGSGGSVSVPVPVTGQHFCVVSCNPANVMNGTVTISTAP